MILKFQPGECEHPTVMKNMCAECGADLQQEMSMVPSSSSKTSNVPASISIVHSIPELKVSSNVIFIIRSTFISIFHSRGHVRGGAREGRWLPQVYGFT